MLLQPILHKIIPVMLLAVVMSASADGIVYDPTNWIQNQITAANSVKSLTNQIKMLDIQLQSLRHLKDFKYEDLADIIRQVDGITKQGQALSYSLKGMDAEFTARYPNYAKQRTLPNYQKAYSSWDETSLQTFQNSMKAIGLTAEQAENQQVLLAHLKKQSESAEGQTQLMQVSHALTLNTNQQLLTLKQLISIQTNAQTAYMSHEISKASYQERSLADVIAKIPNEYSKESKGFGRIEPHKGFQR